MAQRIPHWRHYINKLKGLKPYTTTAAFEDLIFEAGHLIFPREHLPEVMAAVAAAKKVHELEKHLQHLVRIEALLAA